MTTINTTATDQVEPLKPCPFCGSPAELEHGSDHHDAWFDLGCSRHWGHTRNPDHNNTCIAGRMFYTETEVPVADAIAAWNTRASNPVDDRETLSGFQEDEVEEAARAAAKSLGFDYDEVCGHETEADECDSPTCLGGLNEDHDIDDCRTTIVKIARAALSTLQAKRDAREREAVVAWLRDASGSHGGSDFVIHCRQLADAIEAGQHHGGE
ncbi:Lar family restriction alleviation protein [Novosphingobium mathurense]|uniref:Lar family restriction alleviation protein n=1 Tax=Novosphingobium mathurense TaxID=428990 RepID=UPI001116D443|nr:Lar family restriction alleviation protein [Novosphingobium mathurense]